MDGPLRNIGVMTTQFQSFFNAAFRYICLFYDSFLLKNSISPFVSYKSKNLKHDVRKVVTSAGSNIVQYIEGSNKGSLSNLILEY